MSRVKDYYALLDDVNAKYNAGEIGWDVRHETFASEPMESASRDAYAANLTLDECKYVVLQRGESVYGIMDLGNGYNEYCVIDPQIDFKPPIRIFAYLVTVFAGCDEECEVSRKIYPRMKKAILENPHYTWKLGSPPVDYY